MVQLHFDELRIRGVVERSRDELGGYWVYLVEFYDDLLSDTRVTSLATIYNYVVKLKVFLRWLKAHGVKPEGIDGRVVKVYVRELRLRLKPSAMDPHLKALKRFLRLIGKEDLAELIKYPKKPQQKYELPNPELVERVIDEVERLDYKVIIALLYETGARVSEVLALKGKHVREAPEGYFKVFIEDSKNGDFRTVFVIKYAPLLRTFLNLRKPGPEDWLFPSPSRPGKPIHPRNVEELLKRFSRKYGVKLHPHLLRHLRGTQLVKEGMQERIVMKLLGHKTEKMLRIYVNLTAKDVEEVLLGKYGIRKEESSEGKSIKCPRCGAGNPEGARFCWRCGVPLSVEAAEERERRRERVEEVLELIRRVLRERPELLEKVLTT